MLPDRITRFSPNNLSLAHYQCWVQGLKCKDKERTRTKVQGQGKDKDKDKDLRARTKDGSVRIRKGPRTNKKTRYTVYFA